MRPIFVLGNKRSGTSLLTGLINYHPQVFLSYETDAVWMLYQLYRGETLRRYEWDGRVGLDNTIGWCGSHILRYSTPGYFTEHTVADAFYETQLHLMAHTKWAADKRPEDLLWIGDKKPVQYADPKIHGFIREHFDDPLFIHIIRHPHASVGSMKRRGGPPPFWKAPPAEVLKRWVQHERWVLEAKERGARIISLRFESLIADPVTECRLVFDALGLETPAAQIEAKDFNNPNTRYRDLPLVLTAEAKEIMKEYGF